MRTPDIYERVQVLEDEVKLQDSTLDARTRLLWAEITKLKSIIEELKAAQQRKE
ncbi:MAG: hypothetical protein AB7D27_13765 [Desulfomicrobium sp.]